MLANNYKITGDGVYTLDAYLEKYLSHQVVFDSITHTLYWGVDRIYPPKTILKKYSIRHFYGAGIGVEKSPCFLWDIKTLESVNLRDNLITKWKDYSLLPNSLKTIDLGNNPISKREKKRMRKKLKGIEINFN
jgi:Leucine-rich repeat (LRR) protein